MTESTQNDKPIERWMRAWLDIPPAERIAALAAFHALLDTLQGLPLPEAAVAPKKRLGRPPGSKARAKTPANGAVMEEATAQ